MLEEHNQTPGRAGTKTQTQNMLKEHQEGMVGGYKTPHSTSVAYLDWSSSSVAYFDWSSSTSSIFIHMSA